MRTRSILATCLMLAVTASCSDSTGTRPTAAPNAPAARSTAPAVSLDQDINTLIDQLFPARLAPAVHVGWTNLKLLLARSAPNSKPTREIKLALNALVAFMQFNTAQITTAIGVTKEHELARLVLDMELYIFNGPGTPAPVITAGTDLVFATVQPSATTPTTIVTPTQHAGVQFPAGAVGEPTTVIVVQESTPYPDNCSGPLNTHLCQYPQFYHFNVFPDVKLKKPAAVSVCHVDAGNTRLPLGPNIHDRFRLAHDAPSDPTAKSDSSTLVDGIEILALKHFPGLTNCAAGTGTTYGFARMLQQRSNGGMIDRLLWRGRDAAVRLASAIGSVIAPRELYAIDVGGGGLVLEFSNFADVDPESKPDLAQSPLTTTRFHATVSTVLAGAAVPLAAWDVTNLGSGTSGAFTSKVIVASDSALTQVVSTANLAGGAALVPGAKFSYAAQNVTAPTAPGTYFVGTRLVYAGTDSTAADDWVSTRVEVTSLHNYSLLSDATFSTANGGGTGGSSYSLNCGSGNVAVGFSGTAGSYYGWQSILQVQLRCAQLRPDGSLGEAFTTSAVGNPVGYFSGAPFNGTCSNGQVLVGGSGLAVGNEPPLVATLTGSCARVATVVSAGNPESSIGPFSGSGATTYSASFDLPCRLGYAATGIQGGAGDILDGIGFVCTRVVDSQPVIIP